MFKGSIHDNVKWIFPLEILKRVCVCVCVYVYGYVEHLLFKVSKKGCQCESNKILPFARMDRIKARQQKYKKGKERLLSMTQESSEGQEIRKVSEEDDEGTISYCCPVIAVGHWGPNRPNIWASDKLFFRTVM